MKDFIIKIVNYLFLDKETTNLIRINELHLLFNLVLEGNIKDKKIIYYIEKELRKIKTIEHKNKVSLLLNLLKGLELK